MRGITLTKRHCEQSEAIQKALSADTRLPRSRWSLAMTRVLVLAMLSFFISKGAYARCIQNPDDDQQQINEAVYIGKVMIKNIEFLEYTEGDAFAYAVVTAQSLESYKNESDKNLSYKAVYNTLPSFLGKVGRVYERVIFEDENGYIVHRCNPLSPQTWEKLRLNAPEKSLFKSMQNECATSGGEYIQNEHWECVHPTLDAGKSCEDSRQCLGHCIPDLNDKGRAYLDKIGATKEVFVELNVSETTEGFGHCSEWLDKSSCYITLNRGRISKNKVCNY